MADSTRLPASAFGLIPREEPAEAPTVRPGRPHLVVVVTREVGRKDKAPANALLMTRFWHPRDHRWSENFFESLEHAVRLFVDESGWVLRQQQALVTQYAANYRDNLPPRLIWWTELDGRPAGGD